MSSLAERLKATDGRPAGFDYMRIALAVIIVIWHSGVTSYGLDASQDIALGPLRILWAALLPMFFALSGFLVSGSLERSKTLVSFLGLRVIRLVPALAVESVVSIVILGMLFTTLPLGVYFSNPLTARYLFNIVGHIQFYLPGVYQANPYPGIINAQLWTLPFELMCYILISLFALIGAYRLKKLLLLGCIVLQAILIVRGIIKVEPDHAIVGGPILVMSFMWGVCLYRWRDWIPYSLPLAVIAGVLTALLLLNHRTAFAVPLFAGYLTVYLGMTNPPRNRFVSSGDYSYGIFLYGFPIQQAVAALTPGYRLWIVNCLISLPVVVAVSALSWFFVEKPAMRLRPRLYALERRWVPVNDWIATFCGRFMPSGLRTRWAAR